jgi:hypothetical protein
MGNKESARIEFQCCNCHKTLDISTSSIYDKSNPELNLAMEDWFVLFPPQDWLGKWNGHGFCSLDCLNSWAKLINNPASR